MGWPPMCIVSLATNAQLEAEAGVKELEEKLRREKDMWLSTTLLPLGPADNVGEQDNKLEDIVCCFAKLGGRKLPQVRPEHLWSSLI